MNEILKRMVITIGVIIFGLIAYSGGKAMGRIQVASGQYGCILVARPDKTTYWVCNPNKEDY